MAETQANDYGNADTNGALQIPDWLVAEKFENILRENVEGYEKTINFKAYPAMAPGENYATLILRADIEVQLKDARTKTVCYMLKIPLDNPMMKEIMEKHNIFHVEQDMYVEVVPEMEQMLRDAGIEVTFGAKYFKLSDNTGNDCIVLEDLRPRGFKNANRLEGFDMEHTKCVLKKMAQWHAASATRAETKGKYKDSLVHGFFQDFNKPIMEAMEVQLMNSLKDAIKTYKGHEVYIESMMKMQSQVMDEMFKLGKIDPSEFNVLNHGDCWANNIMFQYDAFGKIKETYFVDYQMPKFGSAAQDLFYFLISSTKLELKLKEFDFFIKFYHDNLVEHLNLLKYPKKIPALRDLHASLYKNGVWGLSTATGTMAIVLLDPSDASKSENFISTDAAGTDFRALMYTNARYRKHIEIILPWLYNRGAFELSTTN